MLRETQGSTNRYVSLAMIGGKAESSPFLSSLPFPLGITIIVAPVTIASCPFRESRIVGISLVIELLYHHELTKCGL